MTQQAKLPALGPLKVPERYTRRERAMHSSPSGQSPPLQSRDSSISSSGHSPPETKKATGTAEPHINLQQVLGLEQSQNQSKLQSPRTQNQLDCNLEQSYSVEQPFLFFSLKKQQINNIKLLAISIAVSVFVMAVITFVKYARLSLSPQSLQQCVLAENVYTGWDFYKQCRQCHTGYVLYRYDCVQLLS